MAHKNIIMIRIVADILLGGADDLRSWFVKETEKEYNLGTGAHTFGSLYSFGLKVEQGDGILIPFEGKRIFSPLSCSLGMPTTAETW